MKKSIPITTLFLDIGGVMLTNGWDHHARRRAAANFKLEFDEMDSRHHLNFATYEEGKVTLEEYLSRTVLLREPAVHARSVLGIHSARSIAIVCPEMIGLFIQLKAQYGLRIAVVSNEARRTCQCIPDWQVQAGRVCGCLYFLEFLRSAA